MSLAHPLALAWAALVIPIVALYILKVRPRRVPVSTNLFWRQIFEEKRPRSLWETLRHLLSLLVQLALLGLLVLALADPFFRNELLQARRIVLIVDNSASMAARDGTPTRLDQARTEGLRVIDALRVRDEMAIIVAGTEPAVACGLTGHQRTLREALAAIGPSDSPTRVKEAVELARRLLGTGRAPKSILVLTDAAFPDAPALLASSDVDVFRAGRPRTGNIGITRFQTRRSLLDPVGYEVLVEVVNAADEPGSCRLEIQLDGEIIDVIPLDLAAEGKWSKVIEKTAAGGGRLVAKLDRRDALDADNEAVALLPRREPRAVTLVTDGNLFLEQVLQAIPLVKATVTKVLPATGPSGVTILHRKVPPTLPAGPVFVVDPASSCDLWDLGEPLQNPIVTTQDRASPLLAHVKLENVSMPEARRLAPKQPMQTLAASVTGEPLLGTFERPAGKVVVLTVNLDKSDLPLQTAFPILVSNALSWFTGSKGELREALSSGALAELELPAGGGPLLLKSPDGRTRPLARGEKNKVTAGPLDRVGVWSVVHGAEVPAKGASTAASPPEAEVACNLASALESDLRAPSGLTATAAHLHTAGGLGGRPAWFYLVALAWGLAGLEWYLYQRRWIS